MLGDVAGVRPSVRARSVPTDSAKPRQRQELTRSKLLSQGGSVGGADGAGGGGVKDTQEAGGQGWRG